MTRHMRLQRTLRSPARLARRAKKQRRHLRNHERMWGPGSWCEGRKDHQLAPLDRNPPVGRARWEAQP